MEKFSYIPSGVCSRKIDIEIEDGIVKSVKYTGGCAGNTQGIAKIVEGMDARHVIERFEGIRCGFKSTSCPDQLAQAIKLVLEKQGE